MDPVHILMGLVHRQGPWTRFHVFHFPLFVLGRKNACSNPALCSMDLERADSSDQQQQTHVHFVQRHMLHVPLQ